MKKIKCIAFAKGRPRRPTVRWNLDGQALEICNSYCYLGVVFSASGSMKPAAQALYDKAVGAMFAIIRNTNKHNACNINILLDIFDKMILPIATYNCEVWGINILPLNPTKPVDPLGEKNLTKNLTESLQFRFLKMILRLPCRTSNWATVSEVGKIPCDPKSDQANNQILYTHILKP